MTTNSFYFGKTIKTTNPSVFVSMDNQQLLRIWADLDEGERTYRDYRLRVELELRQRMEADGARAIPHPTHTCELKAPSPTYDLGKLNALRELLPDDVIQTAFTPAHMEMVPDKWDAKKFKAWGKYGDDVRQVIENATIPATPRLIIKAKKA